MTILTDWSRYHPERLWLTTPKETLRRSILSTDQLSCSMGNQTRSRLRWLWKCRRNRRLSTWQVFGRW